MRRSERAAINAWNKVASVMIDVRRARKNIKLKTVKVKVR